MPGRLFQAVIFSVERWAYHGVEMPPYGGIDMTPEMLNETETLFGVTYGMEGAECRFPGGYGNFRILEVSDFMPLDEIPDWISKTSDEIELPKRPENLPDIYRDRAAA